MPLLVHAIHPRHNSLSGKGPDFSGASARNRVGLSISCFMDTCRPLPPADLPSALLSSCLLSLHGNLPHFGFISMLSPANPHADCWGTAPRYLLSLLSFSPLAKTESCADLSLVLEGIFSLSLKSLSSPLLSSLGRMILRWAYLCASLSHKRRSTASLNWLGVSDSGSRT